jgi:HTH-type transcriptional regulator/antitoxin HipB
MKIESATVLGKAIRFHRRRSGLSQLGLAELAQIGKTSVFDMERGKPTVRLATIMAVLRVLNIQLAMESPLIGEFAAQSEAQAVEEQP